MGTSRLPSRPKRQAKTVSLIQSLCLANVSASAVSAFLTATGTLHSLCFSYIWSASNYTRLELFTPSSPVCLSLLHSCPTVRSPICTNWMRSRKCPMIQISQPHGQFINLQFPCSQSPRIINLERLACFWPCGRNRIVDDWSRSLYPFPTQVLFIYPYTLLADSVTSQHHFKRLTLVYFRLSELITLHSAMLTL